MLNSQMFNCASIIAYTHEQEGDKGAQKHHPSQGYPRVPLLGTKTSSSLGTEAPRHMQNAVPARALSKAITFMKS